MDTYIIDGYRYNRWIHIIDFHASQKTPNENILMSDLSFGHSFLTGV